MLLDSKNVLTRHHFLHWVVFGTGVAAMAVAGFILIEGMLKFSNASSTRTGFIAAGIIFQISETICFVACASMTNKSMSWRIGLFALGALLFSFSITVMTLAQKATLDSGVHINQSIDSQLKELKDHLHQKEKTIAGLRENAAEDSRSRFHNIRERGQSSLKLAIEEEKNKMEIIKQLFTLQQRKQQTASEFFKKVETITGLNAEKTEFYFLVFRSLLLELCGIVLMAFAAYLISSTHHRPSAGSSTRMLNTSPQISDSDVSVETDNSWAAKYINALREKHTKPTSSNEIEQELQIVIEQVIDLYKQGELTELEAEKIKNAVQSKYARKITANMAETVQAIVKKQLNLD